MKKHEKRVSRFVHDFIGIDDGKWKDKIIWLIKKVKELIFRVDELDGDEYGFQYQKLEPQFYTNLGLYRNAVNQCFKIDTYTNQIIASQSDTEEVEGFVLSQLSPSGEYLSKMDILQGGHGTSFGLDRVTNGDLKIWFWHEQLKKLIQIEYKPNTVLTLSQARTMTDFTPNSLVGRNCYVTYDSYHDNLLFFVSQTREVQIRKREDVRNHKDIVVHNFFIDKDDWNNEKPWQGGVSYGNDVYLMTGWGEMSSTPIIIKYNAEKGTKEESYGLNMLYGEKGTSLFTDNFREPEGLEFYKNPYNNKVSLLFCLSSGGHLKRYHLVYGLHQKDAEKHFSSLVRINSQKYAFTRSDGRAFQVLESWNDLNKIFKTGYYYIKDDVFQHFVNKPPYPVGTDGGASWWLEVKPADQYWTVRQILTRNSYTPKNIQFERTISLARDNIGNWNIIQSNSLTHPNYLQPNEWGNKLSNVVIKDHYYVTTPSSGIFTDHPEPNFSGWWFDVSTPSSDGRVMQKLTINNDTFNREYRRLVDINTKQAIGSWFKLDYDYLMNLGEED